MVEVKFFRKGKFLVGIESKGHSGFSQKGSDVICAGVSALMHALILGIVDIAGVKCKALHVNDKAPLISVKWTEDDAEKLTLLTQTIAASLKQIALENPKYVKIISSEEKIS